MLRSFKDNVHCFLFKVFKKFRLKRCAPYSTIFRQNSSGNKISLFAKLCEKDTSLSRNFARQGISRLNETGILKKLANNAQISRANLFSPKAGWNLLRKIICWTKSWVNYKLSKIWNWKKACGNFNKKVMKITIFVIFLHKLLAKLHGFANICKLPVAHSFKGMQSKIC